jgi:sodium-dependent dicarboxylate transporter 2/3/5
MIPATLTASCAFMMPIASPTQAIVFGSGHVKIKQMIRAGILFNLWGIIIVTSVFYLLANFVFGIDI